jgi:Domain of unknown function (DUF4421)
MQQGKYVFLFLMTTLAQTFFCRECIWAQAPKFSKHDSLYYDNYPNLVTARFYVSQKYTTFTLKGAEEKSDIRYRPNTTLNLGIGATYHILSLNLAYGFGFMNQTEEKGETKYLDLQGHLYPEKWMIDWYGQFYKGYYLYPKGMATEKPGSYYLRPDLKVNLFGIAAYRVFNNERFSYRAAILQNEWQKKSAGSFLLGGDINYGIIKADSSFVPLNIEKGYPQAGINQVNFFSVGPGVGYAYTLVVLRHFFMMGSLNFNLDFSYSTEKGSFVNNDKFYVTPTTVFRVAAGYNSSTWNLSANWIGNKLPVTGAPSSNKYLMQTGNYRLILAKKIMPGKRMAKRLGLIDHLQGK